MLRILFKKYCSVLIASTALITMIGGIYIIMTATSPLLSPPSTEPPQDSRDIDPSIRTSPTLFIPKIDIKIPFSSSGIAALEDGAWWRAPDSGNPKDGGNFVLSAHRFQMGWTPEQTARKSPLYHIDKLTVGDEIIVDYEHTRYNYTITKIYQVTPEDVDIEAPTTDDRLTLYTCTTSGASDGREVVIAHLAPEKVLYWKE